MSALDLLESHQTLGKEMFSVYRGKNKPCICIIIWDTKKMLENSQEYTSFTLFKKKINYYIFDDWKDLLGE